MNTSQAFAATIRLLYDNYLAKCGGSRERTPVILVLGAAASAGAHFKEWETQLKHEIYTIISEQFKDPNPFIDEAWDELGADIGAPPGRNPDNRRLALLEKVTLEQLCFVAGKYRNIDALIRHHISQSFLGSTGQGKQWSAGPPPLLAYELIAHLLKHGYIDHIISFNFDELLDTALENELGPGGFSAIYSGHEPALIHHNAGPKYLKLHGTASSPESLRFTYPEVTVLTRSIRVHLEHLFGFPREPSNNAKVHILSIGYSWRDSSLSYWVVENRDRLDGVTVVRRESKTPQYLKELEASHQVRVVATKDLEDQSSGARFSSLDPGQFLWVLCEETARKVKDKGRYPLQPIARHLILGNIFARLDDLPELLKLRVRTEILLHLAKERGMVNTTGVPASPRIQKYFEKLRDEGKAITSRDFMESLDLRDDLVRSSKPEARDTFFIRDVSSIDQCVQKLVTSIVRSLEKRIETIVVPKLGLVVTRREVPVAEFLREMVGEICHGAAVEMSPNPEPSFNWIFSRPVSLRSYAEFGCYLKGVLAQPCTHLLAISESTNWLELDWVRHAIGEDSTKKTICLVLPSRDGLEGWGLYEEVTDRGVKGATNAGSSVLCARIPWWRHNRHLFLALREEDGACTCGGGIFFLRRYKAARVSPIYVSETRDCLKLVGTFLTYITRAISGGQGRDGGARRLAQEMERIVALLLPLEPDLADNLEKGLAELGRALEKGEKRSASG